MLPLLCVPSTVLREQRCSSPTPPTPPTAATAATTLRCCRMKRVPWMPARRRAGAPARRRAGAPARRHPWHPFHPAAAQCCRCCRCCWWCWWCWGRAALFPQNSGRHTQQWQQGELTPIHVDRCRGKHMSPAHRHTHVTQLVCQEQGFVQTQKLSGVHAQSPLSCATGAFAAAHRSH